MQSEIFDVLRGLLDHVDRNTCTHESTHRGGFLWTICDDCGMKWADDKGGFKPHADAPAVAKARAVLDAALSEQQAVETFTREQMLAEVERRVGRALVARSALVDVPVVEPVGEATIMVTNSGVVAGFTVAAFPADIVPAGTKLYTSPPLSREGEDSAEVYRHKKRGSVYTVVARGRLQVDGDLDNEKVVIYRGEDGQTWVRPEYEFNDGRFEAIAATRSGSATSPKGCADASD